MSFLVSPGVHVREIDLTNVVPVVATSIGAIASSFEKGPVGSIIDISSEEELIQIFGRPQNDSNQFENWFAAANFLAYTDALKVVRVESGITNATANGAGLLIRDDDHYDNDFDNGQGSVGEWSARTAGTHGNAIGVSICATATAYEQSAVTTTSGTEAKGQTIISVTDASVFSVGDIVHFGEAGNIEYETTSVNTSDNTITIKLLDDVNGAGLQNAISSGTNIRRRWRFYDLFDGAPGTSSYATERGRGTGDEMHIVVYDYTGKQSGFDVDSNGNRTNGILEVYANLSKNINAKSPQGDSIYYPYVIRKQSSFVYWTDHNTAGVNWGEDIDATTGNIVLNSTDGSADAGDKIQLEDGSGATGSIEMESGSSAYSALNTPTKSELDGGLDDYAVTAGELDSGYGEFEDTESIDVNLILGG